jgi:hypothetical protein
MFLFYFFIVLGFAPTPVPTIGKTLNDEKESEELKKKRLDYLMMLSNIKSQEIKNNGIFLLLLTP